MEMGRLGNSGGKVVSFDDAINGRRRNGSSLSSYLDTGRDAAAGGRAAPRPVPAHPMAMASRRRTYADGELDVFAAERYFKGAMDGDGDRLKEGFGVSVTTAAVAALAQVQQPLVETAAARPAAEAAVVVAAKPSLTRASTAASSASSANSRTALVGSRRRSSRDNNSSSRCCVRVGVLMRTCSGKRAVRVDGCAAAANKDAAAEPPAVATGIDWYRELRMHKAGLGFSGDGNYYSHGLVAAGPSLNLGTAKVAAIGREVTASPTGEEKDVAELTFSSSSTRRRSNFTLVAPVRAANDVPVSGRAVGEHGGGALKVVGHGGGAHHLHDDDDDAGSESSSDLFEIKSLMIGDSPYEPSEASVQWSVVTADASSERGGDRVPARWVGGGARDPPVAAGNRQPRGHHRPAGILVGCASHRAVDVTATTKAVPSAVAAVQRRRSEGFHKARNGA